MRWLFRCPHADVESGRDNEAVLLQVAAVSHAVHRAAYLIIANSCGMYH